MRITFILAPLFCVVSIGAGSPADERTVVVDGTGWEMTSLDVDVAVRADRLGFEEEGTMVLRARTGPNAGPMLTLAHGAVGFVDAAADGARVRAGSRAPPILIQPTGEPANRRTGEPANRRR